MMFQPKTLDFDKSPYTGLTRESWIEAAEYLLAGIFEHVEDFDAPIIVPRKETEITYPHLNASESVQARERKAEIFEGLTRSFFIAAPLIHSCPDVTICGYKMRDYYKHHMVRLCTKDDPFYVGNYEELQEMAGNTDSFMCFQQTVETCALVVGLWICKEEIWDTYTKEEKDTIAELLTSFAHGNTVPQNWRLFNMLDMAFLHMAGYPIDKEIMLDHAQAILNYYVGDGWYRDGHSFDYYSCWAFQFYAPVWNQWYGYENEPGIAKRFEEHSNKLMETYGDFFDEDGFTNMWGRSGIYRNAATVSFAANMLLKDSKADPGLARRITSGSLLQFLSRDDFLFKGIPTLGFYGQFSPLVQGYSCAESPFWLGKAFLCLYLPQDHPFWTAKENNGSWEKLKEKEVKQTTLNGPGLCFSNHKASGETILRTGKVVKNKGDIHGMWNYSKLCYNTKYPWEAAPVFESNENGVQSGEVEAQQYVLKDLTNDACMRGNVTFWHGEKKGVLYRRQFFEYNLAAEAHWIQALNLADFTVPNGIVRVDKLRLWHSQVRFTLGAYGFADNGTEIIRKECNGAKAIILKGTDHTGAKKQLAMTIFDGWTDLEYVHSSQTNPDSEKSIVVYAVTERQKQYGGYEPYVMISQVLTKENHEDFTEEELFPIASVAYEDTAATGSYGTVTITMKDGNQKEVNFEEMEASLLL